MFGISFSNVSVENIIAFVKDMEVPYYLPTWAVSRDDDDSVELLKYFETRGISVDLTHLGKCTNVIRNKKLVEYLRTKFYFSEGEIFDPHSK